MKIGYFFTGFPSKKEIENGLISGGQQVVAYNLALKIGERGHEVKIFSASNDLNDKKENLTNNIEIYFYGSIFSIYSARFSFSGFFKPLEYDLDVIHCHCPHPAMDFASLIYKKTKKIPLVLTYHAEPSAYGYGNIIRRMGFRIYKRLVSILLSQADLIISPAKHFIEDSRLKNYKDKVVVIPNGIELKKFEVGQSKEECRRKLNLPADRKILLFLNALLPQKGPDILMRSMPEVIKRFPEVYLVFVGRGEMKKKLEDMAVREGISKHIKFTGFVSEGLKPFYYKAADIFILPSTRRHESFGIVNLEAMACGVPIIASKIGGIPDVVEDGENGLLVPPKDSNALADAIIYLLENEDIREEMGGKAKKKVKNYTWDKIAEQTEKIYKSLVLSLRRKNR